MPSIENNSDDWRETRSRIDSIASAVFLISGGALSLSISVLLGDKSSGPITPSVASLASTSWYFLLTSVFLFLLLKAHMIVQANLLQFKTDFLNNHIALLNGFAWAIGASGFITFCIGMAIMVQTAVVAIHA